MEVYASAEDCAKAEDPGTCATSFQAAWNEHEQTAPKFASLAECEAAVGEQACEQRQTAGGGGYFLPLMAGMMMGRMMSGPRAYPVYMDRRGAAYSGSARMTDPDPRYAGGAGGRALPSRITAPVSSDGRLMAGGTTRGGFGRTSSYRGSAGG